MKPSCITCALLGFLLPLSRAEAIIGYDGQDHAWPLYRDGLHDPALHEHGQPRQHQGLSHPRLRSFDGRHVPHMLNQAPIIVSQHNLRIATPIHHIRRMGSGVDATQSLAAAAGNASQDSATALSKVKVEAKFQVEAKMVDSVYGTTAKQGISATKRDFHFRKGQKKTEQNAAEDLTADEVQSERLNRAHIVKLGGAPGGIAGGPGAAPAGAAGPGPAPAPMGSPAGAPQAAEEHNDGFTMDEDLGAPSQGFSGEIVEHDNMKTMTKDWRGEYGPGSDDYLKICALYPDNQWCHDRGYHRAQAAAPKSAALRTAGGASLTLMVAVSCALLLA